MRFEEEYSEFLNQYYFGLLFYNRDMDENKHEYNNFAPSPSLDYINDNPNIKRIVGSFIIKLNGIKRKK